MRYCEQFVGTKPYGFWSCMVKEDHATWAVEIIIWIQVAPIDTNMIFISNHTCIKLVVESPSNLYAPTAECIKCFVLLDHEEAKRSEFKQFPFVGLVWKTHLCWMKACKIWFFKKSLNK